MSDKFESDRSPPDPHAEQPPRQLTIDDVPRLGSGAGLAIGCVVLVVLAIALFWLLRGWLLHAV